MKLDKFQCSQCGATDFTPEGEDRVRCAYCESMYAVSKEQPKNKANIIIKSGAKVVFGKNSNVSINGQMEIEDGAEVEFLGKITLIEKSGDEIIEEAKQKLKRIKGMY